MKPSAGLCIYMCHCLGIVNLEAEKFATLSDGGILQEGGYSTIPLPWTDASAVA